MKSKPSTPKSENTVEKSFCTTREAGCLLGVSAGTVQFWVDSGLLQAWKTAGGHRRILRDSVNRLLHKQPVSEPLISSPTPPRAFDARRLRVMVVDDDDHMLWLYQRNISRWPMAPEITIINDAVVALLAIGKSCPDLLVTDLHMPGMDGFNMLRVLFCAPEMSNTTIVIASALGTTEIKQRGGIPPGIEVLPKPVPFDRLLTIATGILNQGRFLLQKTNPNP